ncbi:hypothetical protein CYMTET_31462 [Cymbomonas tetramitiformis]|uniref:Uncharacterized protein n=1 Tax=Cymbomonas tetramitiformis TaxID=36881 RepID=A0AAE0FH54_9CHLO|nr:hypothetical protein CYMTET_31462 [Cymbomonas tetramitiformis]
MPTSVKPMSMGRGKPWNLRVFLILFVSPMSSCNDYFRESCRLELVDSCTSAIRPRVGEKPLLLCTDVSGLTLSATSALILRFSGAALARGVAISSATLNLLEVVGAGRLLLPRENTSLVLHVEARLSLQEPPLRRATPSMQPVDRPPVATTPPPVAPFPDQRVSTTPITAADTNTTTSTTVTNAATTATAATKASAATVTTQLLIGPAGSGPGLNRSVDLTPLLRWVAAHPSWRPGRMLSLFLTAPAHLQHTPYAQPAQLVSAEPFPARGGADGAVSFRSPPKPAPDWKLAFLSKGDALASRDPSLMPYVQMSLASPEDGPVAPPGARPGVPAPTAKPMAWPAYIPPAASLGVAQTLAPSLAAQLREVADPPNESLIAPPLPQSLPRTVTRGEPLAPQGESPSRWQFGQQPQWGALPWGVVVQRRLSGSDGDRKLLSSTPMYAVLANVSLVGDAGGPVDATEAQIVDGVAAAIQVPTAAVDIVSYATGRGGAPVASVDYFVKALEEMDVGVFTLLQRVKLSHADGSMRQALQAAGITGLAEAVLDPTPTIETLLVPLLAPLPRRIHPPRPRAPSAFPSLPSATRPAKPPAPYRLALPPRPPDPQCASITPEVTTEEDGGDGMELDAAVLEAVVVAFAVVGGLFLLGFSLWQVAAVRQHCGAGAGSVMKVCQWASGEELGGVASPKRHRESRNAAPDAGALLTPPPWEPAAQQPGPAPRSPSNDAAEGLALQALQATGAPQQSTSSAASPLPLPLPAPPFGPLPGPAEVATHLPDPAAGRRLLPPLSAQPGSGLPSGPPAITLGDPYNGSAPPAAERPAKPPPLMLGDPYQGSAPTGAEGSPPAMPPRPALTLGDPYNGSAPPAAERPAKPPPLMLGDPYQGSAPTSAEGSPPAMPPRPALTLGDAYNGDLAPELPPVSEDPSFLVQDDGPSDDDLLVDDDSPSPRPTELDSAASQLARVPSATWERQAAGRPTSARPGSALRSGGVTGRGGSRPSSARRPMRPVRPLSAASARPPHPDMPAGSAMLSARPGPRRPQSAHPMR